MTAWERAWRVRKFFETDHILLVSEGACAALQGSTPDGNEEQQGVGFSHIWVTDSCPSGAKAAQVCFGAKSSRDKEISDAPSKKAAGRPFEVLTLANLLAGPPVGSGATGVDTSPQQPYLQP
eukprot:1160137-Pelagomonas_calceolata.AAC.22